MKRLFRYMAIPVIFILFFGSLNVLGYYQLYRHGIPVQAHVTGKAAHNQVAFAFEVDGQSYRGINRPRNPNPSFYGTKINGQVTAVLSARQAGKELLRIPLKLPSERAGIFPYRRGFLGFWHCSNRGNPEAEVCTEKDLIYMIFPDGLSFQTRNLKLETA